MRASCVGGLCKKRIPGRMSTKAKYKRERSYGFNPHKNVSSQEIKKFCLRLLWGGQDRKRKRVDEVRDRHQGHAHS